MGREYPIRSPKGGDGNSPSKLAEEDELFSVWGLSPDTRLPTGRESLLRVICFRMHTIDPINTRRLLESGGVGLPGHSSPWGLDHQRSQRSPPRRWRWSGINSRSLRVQLVLLNRSSINALLRDGRPATDRPWSTYPTYHILSPAYVYRL